MKPKQLLVLGLILLGIGGALMMFGEISWKEKHEASVLGAELSVTTKERRRIPFLVSGTILGLGAALTIVGAVKSRSGP